MYVPLILLMGVETHIVHGCFPWQCEKLSLAFVRMYFVFFSFGIFFNIELKLRRLEELDLTFCFLP